jgi:diguanylate cyclase (GGDEF)-like protein/PAS domain S-box-containing protein
MRKSWSIRQLFNLVLLILLVPPSLLLGYSIYARQQEQRDAIQARSVTLARISADDAVSLIEDARYIVESLAKRPLVRTFDPNRCDPILRDLSQWHSEFASLSTIARSGEAICNSSLERAQAPLKYGQHEWFARVMAGKSFLIGAPIIGGSSKLWILPLVQPVLDDSGDLIGVVSLTTRLGRFKPKFAREEFPLGTEIDIIDSAGTYIARSIDSKDETWVGERIPDRHLLATVLAGAGPEPASIRYRGDDAAERVAGFMRVPGTNWSVIATIPTQTIVAAERRSAALNILAVALVLALAIGIAAFVLRNVERSISSIAVTARSHMAGDAMARAAETGPEEIAMVARQLNLMLDARQQAENRLLEQKQQMDAAINNMSQGLLMFDAWERIVVCNRRYLQMYGLPSDFSRICRTFSELISYKKAAGSFEGDIEQHHAELRESLANSATHAFTAQTADGRSIRIITNPMPNGGWVVTHEDITERRKVVADLERTQTFLNTVIENVPATIFVKDARDQRYVLANRAAEQLWGKSCTEVIGKTATEIFSKSTADAIMAIDTELLASRQPTQSRSTHWVETQSGRHCLVATKRITISDTDGQPQYLIGVVEDITERERANDRIAYMAHHDLLTGLANRALFLDKLEEAAARLRQRGEAFTVFMLDLDRFKDVNDSLGHPAGDALLQEASRRLKCLLEETDVLARLGGDEFAILQSGEDRQAERATGLAARIVEMFAEPFDIDESKVVIETSIGIAQAPADGIERNELMKKADLALYRRKAEGRNGYRFFNAQMLAQADARHRLAHDLHRAISNKELELHYQRIIDAQTGDVAGVEALLRWRHPQRGDIAPLEFIPLAEENGLIVPLGEWVLQKACADAARWPPHVKVAINLSPVQLKRPNLFDVILCALVESGLDPGRLELEITESVLIESHVNTIPLIRQLKNLGVSIALDDFGTGYSSLSYLATFPFDKIKIDRSFTQNMTKRMDCTAIILSVVALGYGLKIPTTAEGVETWEQFDLLRMSGVNFIQGCLFGQPCPMSQLEFTPARTGRPAANVA